MAQHSLFQLYDWKQAQPKSFIGSRAETRAGVKMKKCQVLRSKQKRELFF